MRLLYSCHACAFLFCSFTMSDRRGSKRFHSNEGHSQPSRQSFSGPRAVQPNPPAAAKRLLQSNTPLAPAPQQLCSTVTVVSSSQPSHAQLAQGSSSSSTIVPVARSFTDIRVPRITERGGVTSHHAQQRQLSSSSASSSSRVTTTDFLRPQQTTISKPEYSAMALRISISQQKRGGVPAHSRTSSGT